MSVMNGKGLALALVAVWGLADWRDARSTEGCKGGRGLRVVALGRLEERASLSRVCECVRGCPCVRLLRGRVMREAVPADWNRP